MIVYRKTLSHQREMNSRADEYNSHHANWEEAIYKNKMAELVLNLKVKCRKK